MRCPCTLLPCAPSSNRPTRHTWIREVLDGECDRDGRQAAAFEGQCPARREGLAKQAGGG